MRFATHARPPRRRFVDRSPRQREWQALHKVADKAFPALRTLFTQAFTAFREHIDWAEVQTLLTHGNLPGLLVLLEQAWAESADASLRDPLRALTQQIVTQGAQASQPEFAAVVPGEPRLPSRLTKPAPWCSTLCAATVPR